MKVLLAEDEPDVQLIARLSLKKAGLTVVTVGKTESLGYVTQYEAGHFAADIRTGDITGYVDQIVQGSEDAATAWKRFVDENMAKGLAKAEALSWPKIAQRTLDFYQECMKEKR